MPVPAASPFAMTVLMSTSPGSIRVAAEEVTADEAGAVTLCRPGLNPNRGADDDDVLAGGQAKCATTPPPSAASTTTSAAAPNGRRSAPRAGSRFGGSSIGLGGVSPGKIMLDIVKHRP